MRIHNKDWATYDLLGDIEYKNRSKLASLRFYKKAAELPNSPNEMKKKFIDMRNIVKQDTKIAFLCLPGLDNFLKDIVETFSLGYDVKLVVTTDGNQIAEAIKWADIVWLEWANEMTVFATNQVPEIQNKKVVCRLHGYEIFGGYPQKINWTNIDQLIFVNGHKKELFGKVYPNAKIEKVVINNGIDLNKFTFNVHNKNHNLLIMGNINYRKGFETLLLCFEQLLKEDNRYKLCIKGKFQDLRYEDYILNAIKEMNIERNITFIDKYIEDIDLWGEQFGYILSTSIEESFHYTVGEFMAKGIKPVINSWPSAREVWPNECIFTTIDQFKEKILEDKYDSNFYRRFIEDNYSLEEQIDNIENYIAFLEDAASKETKNISNFRDKETSISKKEATPDYTYNLRYKKRNERKIQIILNSLNENYDSALDIGCNRGYIIETLLEKRIVKFGYGLDLDRALVNDSLMNANNFKFYECDLLKFNFPENYDLILYLSVHHHIFGKYGKQKAFELFNEIIDHCNKTLIFETGMLSEVSPDLYWKEEIRKNFNNDVEHLLKLRQLIGPRLKKMEIIGQLPIHGTKRPIIKFSLHPLNSEYDIKVEDIKKFYDNMWLNEDEYEPLEEYRRTIGSKNQKLFPINLLKNEARDFKIFDETIFYKLRRKSDNKLFFAKKITLDRYKQLREFLILTKVNHPRIIKLIGVSEKYGLIFPFLDWENLDEVDFYAITNKDNLLQQINEFFAYLENTSISLGIFDFENDYKKRRKLIDIIDLHPHNFLIKVEENHVIDWKVIDFEYYSNNNYQRNIINKHNIIKLIKNN